MGERGIDDKTVFLYADIMQTALREKLDKVFVVEAAIGCMELACRLLAMMDVRARDQIITVVEEEFRSDVEARAAEPYAKAGVMKLQ